MRSLPKNPSDKPQYMSCCGTGCDLVKLGQEFRQLEKLVEEETERADELEYYCLHWVALATLHVSGGHVDWNLALDLYLADRAARTRERDYD